MAVIADITTSLDGFVTGPRPGPDNGLGDGGEALHARVLSGEPADRACLESARQVGAVVMGRGLFDVVDGPHGWDDGMGFGADVDARPPYVVVTSSRPDMVRLAGSHDFRFVLDGPAAVALREIRREQADSRRRVEHDQLALAAARAASESAQETFANWLKTRDATQRVDQDPGLIARTQQLDALKAAERTIEERLAALARTGLDLSEREAAQLRVDTDLRAAAMNDDRVDAGLLEKRDIGRESLAQSHIAHCMAAVFDDDRLVLVALHIGQRLCQKLCLKFAFRSRHGNTSGEMCGAF